MQGTVKQLTNFIHNQRIDAFISHYEKLQTQSKVQQSEQLKAEYAKWKAKITKIDNFVKESSRVDSKKWINHSTQQVTTSVNRSPNKFQIKSKLILHQGFQFLHKLIANPKAIQQLLPFCQSLTELKTYNDLQKDILLRFKVPFINDRCIASRLILLDRLEEKETIVLYGQQLTGLQIAKSLAKQNVIKVKGFLCQIKIGQKEYLISTYANLDGPLSMIPEFVLKKILHLANTVLMSNISKAIKTTNLNQQINPSKMGQRLRLRYLGRL